MHENKPHTQQHNPVKHEQSKQQSEAHETMLTQNNPRLDNTITKPTQHQHKQTDKQNQDQRKPKQNQHQHTYWHKNHQNTRTQRKDKPTTKQAN